MKSKKFLPIFLAAFSCSSSNAYENNFQMQSGPQVSVPQYTNNPRQMSSANVANTSQPTPGTNNVSAVKVAENSVKTPFKPNIPNNITGQNQKNDKKSSGYGKLALGGLLGLAIGAGGAIYVERKIMDSEIPAKSYGFLWPCVQLSYNYRTLDRTGEHDSNPSVWTLYSMTEYCFYGSSKTENTEIYQSLFLALNKLYSEIKNSKEFKKLKARDEHIFESLAGCVIGIPEAAKDEVTNKWKYTPYDDTKVSADMLNDSEVKTTGVIKDDANNRLYYHATFEKKGDWITLKEWGIDKDD